MAAATSASRVTSTASAQAAPIRGASSLERRRVAVAERDGSALRREQTRDLAPDPGGAADHQGGLALEPVHGEPLLASARPPPKAVSGIQIRMRAAKRLKSMKETLA